MDEERRAELTERLERAEEMIARAQEGEEVDRRQLGEGLADKAWALRDLGEAAEALAVTELLLDEVRSDPDGEVLSRHYGAWGLVQRARCLWLLNRRPEGLLDLAETVSRYDGDDDPRISYQVARAAWMHLSWLKPGEDDEQILAEARVLFARCQDESRESMQGYAALALGAQADAQKRLGDLRAAIATRRWLLSEYPDVRPEPRPALVFDHWSMLAQDLLADAQLGEASRVSAELAAALEDADLTDREMRIANALNVRTWALRRNGCPHEAAEVAQDVQARCATSADPQARRAAAFALLGSLTWLLDDGDVAAAIVVAEEVADRFRRELDPATVTYLGGELEKVVQWMFESPGSWSATVLAGIASRAGAEPFVVAHENRPRLTPLAHVLTRLRCAESANALLAERFCDDPDSRRNSIFVTTILRRASLLAKLCRPRSSTRAFGEFEALGPGAVSAIVDHAEPFPSGAYSATVWMAAMLGATTDLGSGPEADRTRKAIRRILSVRSLTPSPTPFVRFALRDMDRRARRASRSSRA